MGYAEKVAKGSFVVFMISVIAAIVGYSLRLFLSRNLTVNEFGLFYSVLTFLSFFVLFKDIGLGATLAKLIPEFLIKGLKREIKSCIAISLLLQYVIGIFIFLIMLFGSGYLADVFFHNPLAKPVIQILALEFLISVTILPRIFQGFQKMKTFASIEILRLSVIFIIVIFLIPLTASKVAFGYLLASIIILFVFFSYFFKTFPDFLMERLVITKKLTKKLLRFGAYVLIGAAGSTMIGRIDTLTITFFRSLKEVGFYQAALPTSQLLWVFVASLTAVLFPVISEIWTKGYKGLLSDGIQLLIKISFIFITPLALIMIAFPNLAITTLFTPEYLPAAPALQILSIGAIAYTLFMICSTTTIGIGKPNVNTKIILIMAGFNLIFNIILVPTIGIVGAAITTLLSYLLGFLLLVFYLRGYIELRIAWISLLKTFLLGFATLLIIYGIKGVLVIAEPIIEATISLVIAFTIYFFLILRSKVMSRNDLTILKNMNLYIPNKIKKIILRLS